MSFLTFLILFFIIIFIFSFAAVGSCKYSPYSKDIMATNRYNRESFGNFKNTPLGYTSTSTSQDMDDLQNKELSASNMGANVNGCRKIMGFNGLFCDSNREPSNPVDIYSTAKGSLDCQSFGYMNSRGYLCMDENQKKLLTSRGGNAIG